MSKPKIKILSLSQKRAEARMFLPMRGLALVQSAECKTQNEGRGTKDEGQVSQFSISGTNKNDNIELPPVGNQLNETDFIYPQFRAVSQSIVEDYWLDWTTPGVLEAAVPLLANQTVFKNHDRWDVEGWLGVVTQTSWDAAGAAAAGTPGINCVLKIDAAMNPRIARGLSMTPPAIHSVSVTAVFEFEYSHPELVEKRQFWGMLGENVDGELVRVIVTRVIEFMEISLVTMGADRLAKQMPGGGDGDEGDEGDEGDGENLTQMSATQTSAALETTKEKRTVKLTTEQKSAYGIQHDSDDVPDEVVANALASLHADAMAGALLVGNLRSEVRAAATLAELGAAEGELPEILAEQIEQASAAQLPKLKQHYEQRAAQRFPTAGRSSVENSAAVEQAGGVERKPTAAPKIKVF